MATIVAAPPSVVASPPSQWRSAAAPSARGSPATADPATADRARAAGRGAPAVVVVGTGDALHTARARALTADGLGVRAVRTLRAARAAVTVGAAGVVLDRRIPDGDALELVGQLDRTDDRPWIVLVDAGPSTGERVEGLEAGADDVVSAGAPPGELVARVHRLVAHRRAVATPPAPRWLVVGRVVIDGDRRCVRVDGREVDLPPLLYRILVTLAAGSGGVVTRRVLVEQCWDAHQEPATCALRPQISRLRHALGGAVQIRAVRGVGYALAPSPSGG